MLSIYSSRPPTLGADDVVVLQRLRLCPLYLLLDARHLELGGGDGAARHGGGELRVFDLDVLDGHVNDPHAALVEHLLREGRHELVVNDLPRWTTQWMPQ